MGELKDEVSMFQYLAASKAAKKMISFLNERRSKRAIKDKAIAEAKGLQFKE